MSPRYSPLTSVSMYSFTTSATHKILEKYTSDQAEYQTQPEHVLGSFLPIAPSDVVGVAHFVGQPFEFICAGRTKVNVNDILIIANVEYTVKGVQRVRLGGIDILKCLLDEPVTV